MITAAVRCAGRWRHVCRMPAQLLTVGPAPPPVSQACADFRQTSALTDAPKRKKRTLSTRALAPLAAPGEARRSSRVAGQPAKSYDESVLAGLDEAKRRRQGGLGGFQGA